MVGLGGARALPHPGLVLGTVAGPPHPGRSSKLVTTFLLILYWQEGFGCNNSYAFVFFICIFIKRHRQAKTFSNTFAWYLKASVYTYLYLYIERCPTGVLYI